MLLCKLLLKSVVTNKWNPEVLINNHLLYHLAIPYTGAPWTQYGCAQLGALAWPGGGLGMLSGWPSKWCTSRGFLWTGRWMPVLMVSGLGPLQITESPAKRVLTFQVTLHLVPAWFAPSPSGWGRSESGVRTPIQAAGCPVDSWDRSRHTAGVGRADAHQQHA